MTSKTLSNAASNLKQLSNDELAELLADRAILFRYMADYRVKKGHLRALLTQTWPSTEVHRMDGNIFLGLFPTLAYKARCLEQQPWFVGGVLLAMTSWSPTYRFCEIPPSSCETWVQIHGLKMDHLVPQTIWAISNLFSGCAGYRFVPFNARKKFGEVRVRFFIDATKPLLPGCILSVNRAQPYMLSFKYERFQHFCYNCGLLGHYTCDYTHNGESVVPYGEWILGDTPSTDNEDCYAGTSSKPTTRTLKEMHLRKVFQRRMCEDKIAASNEGLFANVYRTKLKSLIPQHVYEHPILGWGFSEELPCFDDNLLNTVFNYSSSDIESDFIKTWEETYIGTNSGNTILNQLREMVQLRISDDGDLIGIRQMHSHMQAFPIVNVNLPLSMEDHSRSSSSSSYHLDHID